MTSDMGANRFIRGEVSWQPPYAEGGPLGGLQHIFKFS